MHDIRNKIASDIPFQFPDVYREEGELFVEFTKQYYDFLDNRIQRDNFAIRDIDTTYDSFLSYFKNKFLNGLPFDGVVDTRFIIKHIQDIYSTKGTEEGLRIFFRMFFDEEIDIFYPSTSIFKPSDSIYKFERYIEMESISSVIGYPFARGDKIIGDSSLAEAFIDQIVFKNFYGAITPIIFLSNLVREFNIDDRLGIVNFEDGSIQYQSPRIAGSLVSIDILTNEARATGNKQSEIIEARSSNGLYGRVSINSVSNRSVGELNLKVTKPGFAYTIPENQGQLTLDSAADEFDTLIYATTPAGADAPTDLQAIRFSGGRRYYGIESVNTIGQNLHEITLSEELEKGFNQFTKIDLFRKNTITDIYITNQIITVKPETVSGLTVTQIAEEILSISDGSVTPTHSQELYDFILAIDPDTGVANGDLDKNGIISTFDSLTFFKAVKQETDEQKKIIEKYSKFIYGEFNTFETISDPNTGASGIVIKYVPPLLFLRCSPAKRFSIQSDASFPANPEDGEEYIENGTTWTYANTTWTYTSTQFEREAGSNFNASNISVFNDSASFSVDELYQPESVSLITDVISDYLNVSIDSADYGMSGPGLENFNTTFDDAFEEELFTIGGIKDFYIYDNGFDYINESYAIAIQPTFTKFKKYDYIVSFSGQPPLLIPGDIAEQEITLFNGNSYTARAEFIRRDKNDNFYFAHRSFYQLDDDLPLFIRDVEYGIAGIRRDVSSDEIGADAILEAASTFGIGQIQSVRVTNAGYNYTDGETVDLIAERIILDEFGNTVFDDNGNAAVEKKVVAKGIATVAGTGFTDGVSQTTTSFLNEPGRVIHDNYYYQEYSYEISSEISPSRYAEIVDDMLSVAGTKLFNSPLINTRNELVPSINIEIDTELFDTQEILTEDDENLVTENQENYIAVETVGLETITI